MMMKKDYFSSTVPAYYMKEYVMMVQQHVDEYQGTMSVGHQKLLRLYVVGILKLFANRITTVKVVLRN